MTIDANTLYKLIKSLHIIFVVSWFSGLFYIAKIFVYHSEVENKPEEEKEIGRAHV